MQTIKQYSKKDNHIIVGKFNEGKLTSFGVADNQMELVTAESFKTAAEAMSWAENYKGLCCG